MQPICRHKEKCSGIILIYFLSDLCKASDEQRVSEFVRGDRASGRPLFGPTVQSAFDVLRTFPVVDSHHCNSVDSTLLLETFQHPS